MFNITLHLLNHQCSFLDLTIGWGRHPGMRTENPSVNSELTPTHSDKLRFKNRNCPKKTKPHLLHVDLNSWFKKKKKKKNGLRLYTGRYFSPIQGLKLCITFIMNAAKTNDHNYLVGQVRATLPSISTSTMKLIVINYLLFIVTENQNCSYILYMTCKLKSLSCLQSVPTIS